MCAAVSCGGGKVLEGGGGRLLREDESMVVEERVVFVDACVFGEEGTEG